MEKKFEWNDDLVLEFAKFTNHESPAFQGRYADLKQFKNKHAAKPEYEVLEFVLNGETKCHFDSQMIDVYGNRESWVKRFLGADCGWQISKVKRLSDGEVFAIGNKIRVPYFNGEPTIVEFDLFGDGELRVGFKNGLASVVVRVRLGHISKQPVRTKLFTTHDGKDIYPGDRVWWVVIHNISPRWTINNGIMKEGNSFVHDRVFSTEQAANDYIILNKPCLSVKEVCDVLKLKWIDSQKLAVHIKIKENIKGLL